MLAQRTLYGCVLMAVCFGCSFVLASDIKDSTAPPASPAELVEAALQAEVNEDPVGRSSALARALVEAPLDQAAHWHSGHVRVGGQWLTVEEAELRAANDPRLIEYRRIRDLSADTVEGQIALARWCRKQNLDVQESLHWVRVMQLSPQNKEAQVRLGLVEFRGQYLTPKEVDAVKEQSEIADAAMKKWKPRVQQWRKALTSHDQATQAAAVAELQAIGELDSIPALEDILAPANAKAELAVVGILSRIDDPLTTELLMRHSVLAEAYQVRHAAALALKSRSLFAFVPGLLGALKMPVEYSYFADTFLMEGPTQVFEQRPEVIVWLLTGRRWLPVVSAQAKAQKAIAVNRVNEESEAMNQRICEVLVITTGQQLSKNPQAWWKWWQQYNELQATQSPLQKEIVSLQPVQYRICSCFLPGTKVWLDTGPVGIEKVRVGDRVLSQDQETGELDYRFVTATTLRPPSPTLRIGVPKEEIVATLGHPLWVVGKGWRMAKEVMVGDHLHGVHGGVPVTYIEKGPESNAYNLVVADFNTYCIGDHRILVHDNLARRVTRAVVPGYVPRETLAVR